MKVIFALPNMGAGGAERVVSLLANELVARHVEVDIWLYYGDTAHYPLIPSVKVCPLKLTEFSLFRRASVIRKRLMLEKKSKDVVFVPFLTAILNVSILGNIGTGVPIVACERNNPYIKGTSFASKFKAMIPFWLANFSVFQTENARKYYSIVSDRKCAIVPNPVLSTEVEWNKNLSPSNLISVCRLHRQKNLPMTLDVIELLKDIYTNIHLDLYGEGDMREWLEKEITNRKLSQYVTLRGISNNVIKEMAEHSIYISTSDYEGISNSMLEAMSIGMPLLCTDCPIGGAYSMLGSIPGALSPVGDSKKFAELLRRILDDSTLALNIAKSAKEMTQNCSIENITDCWINVFCRLIKK